jgi:acetolactate synthase I/II/III large subunit
MKASDYLVDYLSQSGVTHIFEVVGGMITHLVDSADRLGKLSLISMHNEQAAAFAAYAVGRRTGVPGVAMATSGPGAVNLLTGIGGCYFDSVPAIFITGQVNLNEQKGLRPIRQMGFQETDIVEMAKPITKAARMIRSPQEIPEALDDAFRIAVSGRPGPVLLDIPMDIQRGDLPDERSGWCGVPLSEFRDTPMLQRICTAMKEAKKPLILAGGGITSARGIEKFRAFVDILQIPVVNSLMAVDALPYAHPLRVGLIGSYGNRWANLALGSCDALLVLGSRLDIRQTGTDTEAFKNGREIFQVDCEPGEINNRVQGCIPIHADLLSFLTRAVEEASSVTFSPHDEWLKEIAQIRNQRTDTEEFEGQPGINPNSFLHALSQSASLASGYVVDVGNHQMWAAQSTELKANQRFLTSGGMGAMGFSLPAAIGMCFAEPGKPVMQISGDGGMQMNIQELQTVAHHHLPIKMIVLNNHSYGMVRQFQQSYFQGRYASTYDGYSAPDFKKVAQAYGISAATIEDGENSLRAGLQQLWENPAKPFLLQVEIDFRANVYPKIAFGYPITEMEPFVKPHDMEGT